MAVHQKPKGASLELQKGWYRIVFRYGGQKFQRALNTQDRTEAEDIQNRVAGNLKLLKKGRLEYRPGDDLITLLMTDGKLNAAPVVAKIISLGQFFQTYKDNRPPDKERSTVYTEEIHLTHLKRLLGERTGLGEIDQAALQRYVNARSLERNRKGDAISHVTIKKELSTFTSVWNQWGVSQGLVTIPLTLKNVRYPKQKERPAFQTWAEIERKIAQGKLGEVQQAELWDHLFLDVAQVEELLEYVRGATYRWKNSHFPWVLPMFAFCAYTGARRSEMLRSELQDLDFEGNLVLLREKKKDRSKEFTIRRVPMVPQFKEILLDWLKGHPGGRYTFCKKVDEPLTVQMATHYLRWTLEGGKWQVIKGFHTLRHSFISNLASKGISEGIIMSLAGHLNRETTRRYAHLFPSTVEDAMRLVFGKR